MKQRNQSHTGFLFAIPAIIVAGVLAGGNASAADGTWIKVDGGAGSWVTTGFWQDGTIPGSASISNSPDIANFPNTLNVNRGVSVDENRNLLGIRIGGNNTNFNYAFNGGAMGSFVISDGGFIELDPTAEGGTHRDLINAPIRLAGDASFSNNATSVNRTLRIQVVNGSATADNVSTLTISGSNTSSNNEMNLPIGDGIAGGQLALNKTGVGTWKLSGISTYTGATTVSAGTLLVTGQLGNTAVNVEANGTIGGTGTLGGPLHFDEGSTFNILNIEDAMTVSGTVGFGSGFGIGNLTGIDWDSISLGAHTILDNGTDFSAAGLSDFGFANAVAVGNFDRQAYFDTGSLQVVVIPEPDAAMMLGGLCILALLRRRRVG